MHLFYRYNNLFTTSLTNFYDFSFKWTATVAIEIHPTKAWLSLLVNFKNVIWTWGHFRRTICNKILFWTWKKWCHRNVWNASDCFSTILHESSISLWMALAIQGRQGVCKGWWEVWSKEINTLELIGQRVTIRVTILRF